jgi:hypothetical protein
MVSWHYDPADNHDVEAQTRRIGKKRKIASIDHMFFMPK